MAGWEPRRDVTYRFDRTWWKPWTWAPVGATVEVEPEWSVGDVDWLLASRDYEAGIGSHGHPLDEAVSREANPANGEGAWHYVTDALPVIDWAERARVDAAEKYRKSLDKDQSAAGAFFPVRKVWRT